MKDVIRAWRGKEDFIRVVDAARTYLARALDDVDHNDFTTAHTKVKEARSLLGVALVYIGEGIHETHDLSDKRTTP